ncbi:MAG: NADH-ubiquinone oxidoreductase-F iron-sulfur binding region domain-containing protein [Micromonosporaceae bacterium]
MTNPLKAAEVVQIGTPRLTAGLDRMFRLDLASHLAVHGPFPRLTISELIDLAESVDLRGRGGAAFPVARKLKATADSAARMKSRTVVLVNASEGEPASTKDKMLMIRVPHLVLGGAVLAGRALRAQEIVVGVESGSPAARSILEAAGEAGLRRQLRVVEVPERFISGEGGALVNAVNGRPPVPPGRKTRASDSGVDGLPTYLSNAETFAQLGLLALLGADEYRSAGTADEPGTVLLTVGGSAKKPAVVETPAGVPLGPILEICEATMGEGVLVGGYHGMWLPPAIAATVPVSRNGMAKVGGALGAGIVAPLGDGTCPLGEVARVASYLAGESSGQCGPCKLGLPSVGRALTALADGSGGMEALETARRGASAVRRRGACSHPDGTSRFVLSALNVFTDDIAAHVFNGSCGRQVRGVLPLESSFAEPESGRVRFEVDWTRCEGHGLCAKLVPELVHLDRNGYPVFLDAPVPFWLQKEAEQAVEMCPALALRLSSGQSSHSGPAKPAIEAKVGGAGPAVRPPRTILQLPAGRND